MLTKIRQFAKSWVAAILIGLLVVSFAVFGINDVFGARFSDSVVSSGSRQVKLTEFRRIFDSYKAQISEQAGRPVTNEEIAAEGLLPRILEDLAGQQAFAEWFSKVGIRPGDELVAEQIRQAPVFFNPVSGAFDKDRYAAKLREQGATEEEFERALRDDIASNHFAAGMVAGMRAPRIYGALQSVFSLESRDVSWFVVDRSTVPAVAPPTDAQLQAFVRENEEQLKRPELRQISVVVFTASMVASGVTVDDAEVRRRYEFRRESLSQPERRTFVQIPARDQAAAERIAVALRAGQTPAAVARANGVEPIQFDQRPRSAVSDPQVAAAAFSLQPGQVSGPVRGQLGFAVVQVQAVLPGRAVSFEEARPQIVEELRAEAATERVYDLVQKYEEARDGGATMDEAARAAGVQIQTLPPVTRQGFLPNGQRLGAPPALFETAWAQAEGGESEVEDAGEGEYFVVRVDKVFPSAVPPLAEIRGPLTQSWTLRETVRRVQARADELAARVRRGEDIAVVARSAGAELQTATNVERDGGEGGLGQEFVSKLFSQPPGEVFTARGEALGFAVAKIGAVHSPAGPQAARLTEQVRPAITMNLFQHIGELSRSHARGEIKTRTDENRARAALGLEPVEPAPPEKKQTTAPAKK